MKYRLKLRYLFPIILLTTTLVSCNKGNKKEISNEEVAKVLKQNSPLDEKKIQTSNAIMMDIYNQMNFIPDMDYFLAIVNQFKKNHLFVNADIDSYIILGVTNKGFRQIPDSERFRLIDTSSANSGYKLNFLIHHIVSYPKKKYQGMLYRSIAGEDIEISDNRRNLKFKTHDYGILSSLKYSDELEIIAIDSVLYR